ncbi:MAG: NAD(P)/FAD-dependent oxidoreductase [Desulfitobacteriaceae bacterium]|nr:NAD(P)/FAD-dependent oxidoreductase [Desulfitobacteriaceae bacterium]
MTEGTHVIIIGGGASGMMAAISARRRKADVTILERNPRIGKKILVTGNGRCNFTNIKADIDCYHGTDPHFVSKTLVNFSVEETIEFFEKLGIAHKVESQGKVFPMSDQASSVLDLLMYELNKTGVNIICNSYVKEIKKTGKSFTIKMEDGTSYQGDRVIIAAGGKAMPSTGSDGNGFDLAKKLGHTIIDIFPGLVQLKLEGEYFKQIQGVKFVGTAEIIHNNRSLAKDRGDILFANYGVSGPPILQISRKAGELIHENKDAVLKISIIDQISKTDLKKLLTARFANEPNKTVEFSLVGLINKRLIPVLLKEAGIKDLRSSVKDLSSTDQAKIINILADWRFKVRGTKSWPSSQVTAGGVATKEINPDTMESQIIKGLFFAGEIIDIDGQCGGFNLQWAWSSGFISGKNASQ